MDSRPHDGFIPPEPAIPDDVDLAAGEVFAPAEAVNSSENAGDGAMTIDFDRDIEDLELGLASLLEADLDLTDDDEPAVDEPAMEAAATAPASIGDDAAPDVAVMLASEEQQDTAMLEATPAESQAPDTEVQTIVATDGAPANEMDSQPAGEAVKAETPSGETMLAEAVVTPEPATEEAAELVFTAPIEALETEPVASTVPDTDARTVFATDEAQADQTAARTAGEEEPDAPAGEAMLAEAVATPATDEPAAAETLDATAPEASATPLEASAAPAAAAPEAGEPPAVGTLEATPAEASAIPPEASAAPLAAATPAAVTPVSVTQTPGLPPEAETFAENLGARGIAPSGFEAAVRSAADLSEGRFLFQMPVHTVPDCQRVAAVNLARDDAPLTVLVLLAADGRSLRMEDARESSNPFAGMAVSYGGLLAHLKSLPSRAAA